jgi:acyl carrier protein
VDSFGIVETVMFLEQEFGIRIARADVHAANFQNIAALAEFVGRRLAS